MARRTVPTVYATNSSAPTVGTVETSNPLSILSFSGKNLSKSALSGYLHITGEKLLTGRMAPATIGEVTGGRSKYFALTQALASFWSIQLLNYAKTYIPGTSLVGIEILRSFVVGGAVTLVCRFVLKDGSSLIRRFAIASVSDYIADAVAAKVF